MEKQKITIKLANQSYTLLTDGDGEKTKLLADELDKKISAVMSGGTHLSVMQALVLVLLDEAQSGRESAELAEKYKSEICEYLDHSEQAMTERDKYKRENERLKNKINAMAEKLAKSEAAETQ